MPSPPTHICPPRPSSLSSLAVCKSPLAPNPADVTPAPWCAPQPCATIALVSHVSCTSCSTPRLSVHTRDHMCRRTCSCLWKYLLPFRTFYLSIFILDSSLFSLASLLPPLPSGFDHRRSFRPRARCRTLRYNTLDAFF